MRQLAKGDPHSSPYPDRERRGERRKNKNIRSEMPTYLSCLVRITVPAPLRLHMFGGIAVHNYHPFAYIYVHPLSPLLPINKRAVPQRGEQGERAVILSGLLLLLRCCCCCCFTSRSKEEPSDWATSLLRFDNFSTLGPLFLRLPTDAPFCISLLVSPFFRGVPDLPFQMHLVSV